MKGCHTDPATNPRHRPARTWRPAGLRSRPDRRRGALPDHQRAGGRVPHPAGVEHAALIVAVGATFIPILALLGLLLAICRRRILAIIGVLLLIATTVVQMSGISPARRSMSTGPPTSGCWRRTSATEGPSRAGSSSWRPGTPILVSLVELTRRPLNGSKRPGLRPRSRTPIFGGTRGRRHRHLEPLSHPVTVPGHQGAGMPAAARIQLPGVQLEPIVAAVHVYSPLAGDQNTIEDWNNSMASAKGAAGQFRRGGRTRCGARRWGLQRHTQCVSSATCSPMATAMPWNRRDRA